MRIALYILMVFCSTVQAQELAVLKYSGGGDWYANPTALPNLIRFCNQNIGTKLNPKPATVEVRICSPTLLCMQRVMEMLYSVVQT
jgi:hypothetical protein